MTDNKEVPSESGKVPSAEGRQPDAREEQISESSATAVPIGMMLRSVDVELSSHCNASCVFCPREEFIREKAIMTPTLFERLLSELSEIGADELRWMYFCGMGEPLLNKHIFEFADKVNEVLPDTLLQVVSNGGALDMESCEAILTGGIYAFVCSIPSIRKERYEETLRAAHFDSVMHWMKYMAQRKSETGLLLSVSCVTTSQTDEELEEYHSYWSKLGVMTDEAALHSRGGFLYQGVVPKDRLIKWCSLFETRLFVAANGDVLACCNDLDGQSKLGNIAADSLQLILERKIARMLEGNLYPMCTNCDDVNSGIYV